MIRLISTLLGAMLSLYASDFYIFGSANKAGEITPKSIEAAFVKAGFTIADNRDMNGPFTKQFGQSTFATYNLFTLYHPVIAKELVDTTPDAGIFVPMSMGIYQKKGG